jgi:adenylate cyclase
VIVNFRVPPAPPQRFRTELSSIIIGRVKRGGKRVDLDLSPDTTISNTHACLSFENGTYWIQDLNSTNGTLVAGELIRKKTPLAPGVEVRIGQVVLTVEPEPPAPPPRPAPKAAEEVAFIKTAPYEPVATPAPPQPVEAKPMPPEAVEAEPLETKPAKESRRLKAFYDLTLALCAANTLDSLEGILVKQLRQAIPSAQRGAVLLPDERGELLLKIHWPSGAHSVSMTLAREAFEEKRAITWDAPEKKASASGMPSSVVFFETESALYVPLISGQQTLGVMYVDNAVRPNAFSPADLELLTTIAKQVAGFVRDHVLQPGMQREEIVRSNLLRQFSPKVADFILEESGRLQLGGNRVDPITILVSDVRGFTSLSARMEPGDVVRMLNEMFDAFVPIIFEYDGVIDKYVGDSVLAVFGSPEADERQWEKAVRAAVAMQEAMAALGEAWRLRRLPVFEVGIGIHSGEAIQGFIGSSQRIEYTVIGDTVNRAARFCDGASPGEILISNAVYEHVYRLVEVEAKTVRTKHPETEPDLKAYLVKGLRVPAQRPARAQA